MNHKVFLIKDLIRIHPVFSIKQKRLHKNRFKIKYMLFTLFIVQKLSKNVHQFYNKSESLKLTKTSQFTLQKT